MDWPSGGFIAGTTCGLAIGFFAAICDFRNIAGPVRQVKLDLSLNRSRLFPIWTFAFPIAISVGLNWTQFHSYRLFLEELSSLQYLGLFVSGYMVSAGLLGAFETTVQQIFYPLFYKEISESDKTQQAISWQKYSSLMIPVTLLVAGALVLLTDPLVHFMLDEKFWGVKYFVWIGCFIESCRIIGNVYNIGAHATKETKILVSAQAVGALIVLIGTPIAIKYGGTNHFPWVLILAGITYVGVLHNRVVDHLGRSLLWGQFKYFLAFVPFALLGWRASGFLDTKISTYTIYAVQFVIVSIGLSLSFLWLWKKELR